MKKSFALITGLIFIATASFSQTIKENIQKQAKDPKTAENAAKADVIIINKKTVTDSTAVKQQAATSNQTKSTAKRKKKCRKS